MTTIRDLVRMTPIERHLLNGVGVYVKREDLCSPFPGPSFSKIRGVVAHMRDRPEMTIGVLDTYHSKAGWAVSYVGRALGKRVINFWPHYTLDALHDLRPQQQHAERLGATLVALKAGRSSILYHQARKQLASYGTDVYLMPNALKLPESVTENAKEAARGIPHDVKTVVISISSGTVAAGVVRGLSETRPDLHYIFHMGYDRSEVAASQYLFEAADVARIPSHEFINEGYAYRDAAKDITAPFPCNPYYDLKAWKWLAKAVERVDFGHPSGHILFWNIGA